MKGSGKPDDRKGHVRFDVAGAGNGFTVRLVRHRQTKETEQIGFTYGTPRQSSTLLAAAAGFAAGKRCGRTPLVASFRAMLLLHSEVFIKSLFLQLVNQTSSKSCSVAASVIERRSRFTIICTPMRSPSPRATSGWKFGHAAKIVIGIIL